MVRSNFRPEIEIWPCRACPLQTQYNPCQEQFGRCAVAMRQISRSTECVSSSMKHQLHERAQIAEISPFTRKSGSWSQTPMSEFFYRNRLNRRLCACAMKTQLDVATNAAKSPKYQSLHAKFRTLLFTITVVDFGKYSHI